VLSLSKHAFQNRVSMTSDPRKLFVFLRDPDGRDIAATQNRLRAAISARDSLFAKASTLSFCRIGPPPAGLPPRPDDAADPRPAYDAAIRAEFADAGDTRAAFDAVCKAQWLGQKLTTAAFLVTPIPVLERLGADAKPAIKYLALNIFHDDLPDSAAKRSWAQHAKLAGIVHTGAGRYVRNWVEARMPSDPPIRGIVEIDFAEVSDLTERYFGIPGGMDRVIQDIGHFLQRGIRLYMQEEKLR
jgi:hypothetical protein